MTKWDKNYPVLYIRIDHVIMHLWDRVLICPLLSYLLFITQPSAACTVLDSMESSFTVVTNLIQWPAFHLHLTTLYFLSFTEIWSFIDTLFKCTMHISKMSSFLKLSFYKCLSLSVHLFPRLLSMCWWLRTYFFALTSHQRAYASNSVVLNLCTVPVSVTPRRNFPGASQSPTSLVDPHRDASEPKGRSCLPQSGSPFCHRLDGMCLSHAHITSGPISCTSAAAICVAYSG